MSTPTATPRTDDEETPLITNHRVSAETYKRMVDLARELETELACEKENRNLLIEKGAKLETELAAAQAERDQLSAEVKRWQAEAEEMSAQRSHNANQAGRLRAELAVAENWVSHHSKHADDLIAENVKLRAEVEALKQSIESGQRVLREDAERNAARAERAEAALAEWSVLNLWGGTPEIIHEFIKGQQNRIHHCQDLEAELAEAVDGEINGGSIPDTLLVIHVPRSPVGYRVGQPVKVILPAIDAAMKGTT